MHLFAHEYAHGGHARQAHMHVCTVILGIRRAHMHVHITASYYIHHHNSRTCLQLPVETWLLAPATMQEVLECQTRPMPQRPQSVERDCLRPFLLLRVLPVSIYLQDTFG